MGLRPTHEEVVNGPLAADLASVPIPASCRLPLIRSRPKYPATEIAPVSG